MTITSNVKFSHVALTFPRGTFTPEWKREVDSVYVDLLGWRASSSKNGENDVYLLLPDPEQWLHLEESDAPVSAPGMDHVGLQYDTRSDVDEILERVEKVAAVDDRMQIFHFADGDVGDYVFSGFYFKWLLPVWMDVQTWIWKEGKGLDHHWEIV